MQIISSLNRGLSVQSGLVEIIKRESVNPDELLVIGDGKSDRDSANNVKCGFLQINSKNCLRKLSDF